MTHEAQPPLQDHEEPTECVHCRTPISFKNALLFRIK